MSIHALPLGIPVPVRVVVYLRSGTIAQFMTQAELPFKKTSVQTETSSPRRCHFGNFDIFTLEGNGGPACFARIDQVQVKVN